MSNDLQGSINEIINETIKSPIEAAKDKIKKEREIREQAFLAINGLEEKNKREEEVKEKIFNIFKKAGVFDVFEKYNENTKTYSLIKSKEDLQLGDNLYACLYYYSIVCKFLKKFKNTDNIEVDTLKNIIASLKNRIDFSIDIPDILYDDDIKYKIFFSIPAINQIEKIVIMRARALNFCLLTDELYVTHDEDLQVEYYQMLQLLKESTLICSLKDKNNSDIDWSRFNEDYIDMLPLATGICAVISILYLELVKKKKKPFLN